jgi:hypothetical protein
MTGVTTSGELLTDQETQRTNSDEQLGFIRQFLTSGTTQFSTPGRTTGPQPMLDHDSFRRHADNFGGSFVLDTQLGLFTSESPSGAVSHRELLYQTLIAQNIQSVNELEQEMGGTFSLSDQVVGSVEVVTTVSSVGYLVWNAVRGGMLLSSLMAQIPAWNMLDPLLVIDGDAKEEDKESLQNIMDQQQKKLKRDHTGKDTPT